MSKKPFTIILSTIAAASFCLSAFAGYQFDEDGSTSGYTYSGTNDIYSNGIYVGTDPVTGLPIYKFEMDNQNNTYNGTNQIYGGGGSALFDGYDNNGTYSGTLAIEGNEITENVTQINNAQVNATTTITANEALPNNELNAGVQINDSTFTKDVTIQSSTVNLNSEANVILGSSSQMDQLLSDSSSINSRINTTNTNLNTIITRLTSTNSFLSQIRDTLYIIKDNLLVRRWGTSSTASTPESITYNLQSVNVAGTTYYGNFHGILRYHLSNLIGNFVYTYVEATTNDAPTSKNTSWDGYPLVVIKGGYSRFNYDSTTKIISESFAYYYTTYAGQLSRYINTTIVSYIRAHVAQYADWFATYFSGLTTYSFYTFVSANNGEYYTLTTSTQTATWWQVIQNRLDTIISLLNYHCSKFFEWYYPLDGAAPYYWRTYNSDTDQEESVNLARLMYDISWYLGHITIGENIKTEVQSLSNNLTSWQTAEQNIQNQVQSYITNFAPDVTRWSAFVAMNWVSSYLSQVLLALGTYGQVIMIGLFLGVCMQFIGYFRYKF